MIQCFVGHIPNEKRFKSIRNLAVVFTGIPLLNHLARSKFLKFVTSLLQTFNRDFYGNWEAVQDCYPNQWPSMIQEFDEYSTALTDFKLDG